MKELLLLHGLLEQIIEDIIENDLAIVNNFSNFI